MRFKAWLPALLTVAAAWLVQRQHILNQDVGQFLYAGRMALSGEGRMYRDFIEFNLPLVSYLTALPAEVAAWVGVDPVTAVVTALFLAAIGSTALTLAILAAAGTSERVLTIGGSLMLAALLWPSLPNLGQREHLMAMLAAPWLAAVAVGGRGGLPAALLAGLGFALKPHFVVMPAAVLLAAGGRAWRLAVPALAVTLACHAATLALFPEYRTEVVPMALRYYSFWHVPRWLLITHPPTMVALALTAVALWREGSRGTLVLTGAVLGGLAIDVAQARGFDYHRLPMWLAAMAVLAVPAMKKPGWWLPVGAMAWIPVLIALHPWEHVPVVRRLVPEVRACPQPAVVAALAPHPFPLFPLLNVTGGRNALRYPSLWMWPAFEGASPAETRPFVRAVVADLLAHRPCLVIVDGNSWHGKPQPFLPMLLAEEDFRAFWRGYGVALEVGGYTVWRRTAD